MQRVKQWSRLNSVKSLQSAVAPILCFCHIILTDRIGNFTETVLVHIIVISLITLKDIEILIAESIPRVKKHIFWCTGHENVITLTIFSANTVSYWNEWWPSWKMAAFLFLKLASVLFLKDEVLKHLCANFGACITVRKIVSAIWPTIHVGLGFSFAENGTLLSHTSRGFSDQ